MTGPLFAAYLRTSTASSGQSPQDSKTWQMDVSKRLIAPVGGEIVAIYHDIDVSREIPWKRRPEASRLLSDLQASDRAFDALVIAEPSRAFSGSQVSLVLPLLTHAGVTLWVPECGGPVDPNSDSHDLLLGINGILSKGERRRIQLRTRNAVAAHAKDGRILGGRAPYGLRTVATDVPHPQPKLRAMGVMLKTFEPDPETAPVVRRIFEMFDSGLGYRAIANVLEAEGLTPPGERGPVRHPRSSGRWSPSFIRACLTNPRYTGFQVSGRQARVDRLLDPNHPADGTRSTMEHRHPSEWVYSEDPAWPALVDDGLWKRVNARITNNRGSGTRRSSKPGRAAPGRYLLTGLIRCGHCGGSMNGSTMQSATMRTPVAYYRCQGRHSHPLSQHPKPTSLREDSAVTAIDQWLDEQFAAENRSHTIELILAAQEGEDPEPPHVVDARRATNRLPGELQQVLSALRAGMDPELAAGQTKQIQAEISAARAVIETWEEARPARPRLTAEQVEAYLQLAGGGTALIGTRSREERAALYRSLGLTLTYNAQGPDPKIEALLALHGGGL